MEFALPLPSPEAALPGHGRFLLDKKLRERTYIELNLKTMENHSYLSVNRSAVEIEVEQERVRQAIMHEEYLEIFRQLSILNAMPKEPIQPVLYRPIVKRDRWDILSLKPDKLSLICKTKPYDPFSIWDVI